MDWYLYPLAVLAGALAGFINTLAGSGSLVTLAMLDAMGIPATIANATNRVGVLVQNAVGIATFRQSGNVEVGPQSVWLVVPAVIGGSIGAVVASTLDKDSMRLAIGIVMCIMLVVILVQPNRWLRQESEVAPGRPSLLMLVIFFVIGIYGGFIQAGVGVFLLSALVLGIGYSLKEANLIKLIIILFLTIGALLIFILQGQIWWGIGALMAVGQSAGAWLAARFATQYEDANVWVRRLLIVVVVVAIVRAFDLVPF
ncbi:MAG: sulfite exporter TauE/SafE family protein [Chloroflexota bacterium]